MDHSYDGLDNSSQGSTALAQVINTRKELLKSTENCGTQDHSRGNLNYTASPAHHLDYRFEHKHKAFKYPTINISSLESLAEEYTDEPSIGWKRRRRSEEIL